MSVVISEVQDLRDCHALRLEVFVKEQGVTLEEEMDEFDDGAIHLLAVDGDLPVGTARILRKGVTGKIGRVCVAKSHRGTGLGAALIRASLQRLAKEPVITRAQLGAQTHAIGFYEKLGFKAYGPVYDDASIPHRDMERDV
ncbi:MAG: ElaA protein [Halocynthiibacter sp.]|jgi:predicted GNAT family N-acyltransferase